MKRTVSVIMAAVLALTSVSMQGFAEEIILEEPYVQTEMSSEEAEEAAASDLLIEDPVIIEEETKASEPDVTAQPDEAEKVLEDQETDTGALSPVSADLDDPVGEIETVSVGNEDIVPAAVEETGERLRDGDYEYVMLSDGTVKITGFYGAGVQIPTELGEDAKKYPVTQIGDGVFENHTDFGWDLYLFEGITSIGARAFAGCTGMGPTLSLPEGLEHIGAGAFEGCREITKEVILPESLTEIGDGVFSGCKGLTCIRNLSTVRVELPEGSWYHKETGVLIPANAPYIQGGTAIKVGDFYINGKYIDTAELAKGDEQKFTAVIENLEGEPISFTWESDNESVAQVNADGKVTARGVGQAVITATAFDEFSATCSVTVRPKQITVSFDSGNGTEIPSQTVDYGTCVTEPPAPEKEGYKFYGWRCGDEQFDFSNPVTGMSENIILKAVWGSSCRYILREDGTAEITGYDGEAAGELFIPEMVEGHLVTSIGYQAFDGCSGFTKLTLPQGLVSIEDRAFRGCDGFAGDLILPDTLTSVGIWAFDGCHFTGNLKLPKTWTIIEDSAFSGCEFTGTLELPEKLTEIGENAFSGCGFTGDLALPQGLTSIGNYAFSDCSFTGDLTLPQGLTSIGDYAFWDCGFTGDLALPQGLTSIGNYAFSDCSFTGKLTLPQELTSIGNYAFQDNRFTGELKLSESLQSIGEKAFGGYGEDTYNFEGDLILPDSLEYMGAEAFYNCSFTGGLKLPVAWTRIEDNAFSDCHFSGILTLPEKLESVGNSAFSGCGFTGALLLPQGLTDIGDYAFRNNRFTGELRFPESLKNIGSNSFGVSSVEETNNYIGDLILPEGLESIGTGAFYNCNFTGGLKLPKGWTRIEKQTFFGCQFSGGLTLPENLTDIEDDAFWNCGFTGNLELPEKLITIGERAFSGCEFTDSLTLPQGLTNIGSEAFSGSSFTGELILPESLTSLGQNVFTDCDFTGDLRVPENLESIAGTFYNCSFTGGLELPEGWTNIEGGAFSYCRFSGELKLPESLKSIGKNVFSEYDWTEGSHFKGDLKLPAGLESMAAGAFKNCSFTGDLVLPKGWASIEDSSFSDCGFSGGLKLPDNLTSIGTNAFLRCGFTGELVLPTGLTSIGDNAFSGCGFTGSLTLPESLISMGAGAFSGCGFTGELRLPESLISIGSSAFSGCGFTGELVLPESLTSIGEYAFHGNHFTGKLSVPKGVTELGANAFFDYLCIGQNGVTELFAGENTILDICGMSSYSGSNVKWEIDPESPYPLLTWSSSDEGVAQVDTYGKVTAISAGKATITVTSYDNKTVEIPFRILAKESGGYDSVAPAVTGVRFQESILKPGIVKISMDLIEENTGITSYYGYFQHVSDGTRSICFNGCGTGTPTFSGTYTCTLSVPSNTKAGEYYLSSIYLTDQAGNSSSYSYYPGEGRWSHYTEGAGYYADVNVNDGRNQLVIEDEYDVAFQSSTANPNVTSKLKEMADGSAAMINFDYNNHIVKKEWFEAIKGTDKKLILSNDGIQWVFYGKDITDPKDIDCAVTVDTSYMFWEESEADLRLIFASNGILPGKATVRIKSDYILNMYNLSNTLYLYFLREDGTLLLEDMPQYILDGSDHWCEFELTHNSTFVISGRELSESEQVKPDVWPTPMPGTDPAPEVKPTPTPGTDPAPEVKPTPTPGADPAPDVNPIPDVNPTPGQTITDQSSAVPAPPTVSVSSVTLDKAAADVAKGKSVSLKVTVAPESVSDRLVITWTSSNPSVAMVDRNGTVRGKSYGIAVITAMVAGVNGKSAQCTVTVGRKGYQARAWYTDKKCTKKASDPETSAAAGQTLYAKWTKIKLGKATVKSFRNSKRKKAVLKFKKVKGAEGYEIVYGTNRKLKKNAQTITTTKLSVTLKNLAKKTYYVKVRAYKTDSTGAKVYGKYSSVKRVKIKK